MRARFVVWLGIAGIAGVLLPATAEAQAGGLISGLVTDATGGVLPGVMVTATSPVLIEGTVRGATDGAGRYTIINLRPGTYTVTFTLDGFNRLVREGLLLTGNAAIQLNVQLSVGPLEESVTISAQSLLVDVQQVRSQIVATREMMDMLPGSNTLATRALLIPGVRNTGMGDGAYFPVVHGSNWRDVQTMNDGMRANVMLDDGEWQMGWEMNQAATAELTYEAGGMAAEMQSGGVVQNAIPKEGGNTFSGTWFTSVGHENLASDNADANLRAQLGDVNRLAYSYETNPGFGGPILRNRLWFFGAFRRRDTKTWAAGSYFTGEGTPEQRKKNGFPAAGEQAYTRQWANSGMLRLTNLVNVRHKWRIAFEHLGTKYPLNDANNTRAPESGNRIPQPVQYHAQARWTSTVTSRLLLEAGYSTQFSKWRREQFEWNEGPDKAAYNNIANNTWSGAFWITGWQPERAQHVKGSASYVTGSHNFKAGVEHRWGSIGLDHGPVAGDLRTHFHFNGFPIGVMVLATPLGTYQNEVNFDTGMYAQDQWTLGRWTLNLGTRLDLFKSQVPPQSAAAGAWVPARDFPAFPGARWNTIVPRVGVAYDLFGNGKTALKAIVHKYASQESTTLAVRRNPMSSLSWSAKQEFRTWSDLDGNGSVLGPGGRVQYEEVGPSPNRNWGTVNDAPRLEVDKRPGHWEFNAQVQHELMGRVSLGFGWYRQTYHNFWYEDNVAQSYSDYTPFTITAPNDSRLGAYAGEPLLLYNLNPAVFGLSDRLIRNGSFNTRRYDGFEWTAQGRLPNGAFFGGSITTERTFENTCDQDNPNLARFCDAPRPFLTFYKAHLMHPLPGGVLAGVFMQGYPGPDIQAIYNVTNAIAGRPLTGGQIAPNGTFNILPRELYFLPYQRQVNLRFMRRFRFGNTTLMPDIDIFNLFNSNTVTQVNYTCCGPLYLRPLAILQARYARFGLQVDF